MSDRINLLLRNSIKQRLNKALKMTSDKQRPGNGLATSNNQRQKRLKQTVFKALWIPPAIVSFSVLQPLSASASYLDFTKTSSSAVWKPLYSPSVAAATTQLPSEIFQRWTHSFEEDTENVSKKESEPAPPVRMSVPSPPLSKSSPSSVPAKKSPALVPIMLFMRNSH